MKGSAHSYLWMWRGRRLFRCGSTRFKFHHVSTTTVTISDDDPDTDLGGECSMAVDRKRTPSRDPSRNPESSFATASSSSAAYSRHTFTMNRSATLPPPRTNASPPASTYFTHYANDDSHVLEPTIPDANSHFAYSTTLRRHHPDGPLGFPQTPRTAGLSNFDDIRNVVAEEGPGGLFQRAVRAFRPYLPGGGDSHDYETLPVHKDEHRDTPSARFAHVSIDVSYLLRLSLFDTYPSAGHPRALPLLPHRGPQCLRRVGFTRDAWIQRVYGLSPGTCAPQVRQNNLRESAHPLAMRKCISERGHGEYRRRD